VRQATGFDQDKRIKFVGTVYDKALLTAIRQKAFAYLHGHAVEDESVLLKSYEFNGFKLIFDVSFHRNVALSSALYWQKDTLTDVAEGRKIKLVRNWRKQKEA
jgi:rhamnosyltransferase